MGYGFLAVSSNAGSKYLYVSPSSSPVGWNWVSVPFKKRPKTDMRQRGKQCARRVKAVWVVHMVISMFIHWCHYPIMHVSVCKLSLWSNVLKAIVFYSTIKRSSTSCTFRGSQMFSGKGRSRGKWSWRCWSWRFLANKAMQRSLIQTETTVTSQAGCWFSVYLESFAVTSHW